MRYLVIAALQRLSFFALSAATMTVCTSCAFDVDWFSCPPHPEYCDGSFHSGCSEDRLEVLWCSYPYTPYYPVLVAQCREGGKIDCPEDELCYRRSELMAVGEEARSDYATCHSPVDCPIEVDAECCANAILYRCDPTLGFVSEPNNNECQWTLRFESLVSYLQPDRGGRSDVTKICPNCIEECDIDPCTPNGCGGLCGPCPQQVSTTSRTPSEPSMVTLGTHGFALAWLDEDPNWTSWPIRHLIRYRTFSSHGVPISEQIDVDLGYQPDDTYSLADTRNVSHVHVIGFPDGTFIIAWVRDGLRVSSGIFFQRFALDGTPFGDTAEIASGNEEMRGWKFQVAHRGDGEEMLAVFYPGFENVLWAGALDDMLPLRGFHFRQFDTQGTSPQAHRKFDPGHWSENLRVAAIDSGYFLAWEERLGETSNPPIHFTIVNKDTFKPLLPFLDFEIGSLLDVVALDSSTVAVAWTTPMKELRISAIDAEGAEAWRYEVDSFIDGPMISSNARFRLQRLSDGDLAIGWTNVFEVAVSRFSGDDLSISQLYSLDTYLLNAESTTSWSWYEGLLSEGVRDIELISTTDNGFVVAWTSPRCSRDFGEFPCGNASSQVYFQIADEDGGLNF